MDARSIVSSTLALRRSHSAVPLREVFDLVMQGTEGQTLDFADAASPGGSLAWPTTPFGQLVAEAFDTGMAQQDWCLIDLPDPGYREKLHVIWCAEVLSKFAARYQVTISGL